jgi:hypothetical protein
MEGHMFGWSFEDAGGEELGRSPEFADPEAAEEWIGSSWQDLLENGIEAVVLFDRRRDLAVYRMGLRE